MGEMRKRQIYRLMYCISLIMCFSLECISLAFLIEKPNDVVAIVLVSAFAVALVVFTFLLVLNVKEFKLKYFWLGNKYKTEFKTSKSKFNGANEDFLKKFEKTCKSNFRKIGNIEAYEENDGSNWIYSNKENIVKMNESLKKLQKSIQSKKGFVQFCEEMSMENENIWLLKSLLSAEVISFELRYLIDEVFNLCSFNVLDLGLSENYTKFNKERIQKLDEVYSPLLFKFEAEIEALIEKTNKTIKKK